MTTSRKAHKIGLLLIAMAAFLSPVSSQIFNEHQQIANVSADIIAATYKIETEFEFRFHDGPFRKHTKTGTGISINSVGKLLTAKHVVDQSVSEKGEIATDVRKFKISIYRNGENVSFATGAVLYFDSSRDFAVLRLDGRDNLPIGNSIPSVCVSKSDTIERLIQGVPYGSEPTLTFWGYPRLEHKIEKRAGLFTGLVTEIEAKGASHLINTWKISVDIPKGFSGGPLVGSVKGVLGIGTNAQSSETSESMSLAIPTDLIRASIMMHIDPTACEKSKNDTELRRHIDIMPLDIVESVCRDLLKINSDFLLRALSDPLKGTPAADCLRVRQSTIAQRANEFLRRIEEETENLEGLERKVCDTVDSLNSNALSCARSRPKNKNRSE